MRACPFFVDSGLAGILFEHFAQSAQWLFSCLHLRAVNKCCREASMKNQTFWLQLLYCRAGYRFVRTDGGHRSYRQIAPKILKTVPLPLQVFRQTVKKKRARIKSAVRSAESVVVHRAALLGVAETELNAKRRRMVEVELDWHELESQFLKRKRNRIDVSKHMELNQDV